MEKETVALCNDNLAKCFCHESKSHDGIHKCRCGGSWDENKIPRSLPDISRGVGAFPLSDWEKEQLKTKTYGHITLWK